LMRLAFRADIGGIIKLKADARDTEILVRWIRVLVQDLELFIAWLVVWVLLHFGMIVLGRILLGPGRGGPASVVIAVEAFPGFFVALFAGRLGLTAQRLLRIIDVVGGARGASQSPPAWTQRRGILLELATPRDFDFVIALAVVVALEFLLR